MTNDDVMLEMAIKINHSKLKVNDTSRLQKNYVSKDLELSKHEMLYA